MKSNYYFFLMFLLLGCSEKKVESEQGSLQRFVTQIPATQVYDSIDLKKFSLTLPWKTQVTIKKIVQNKNQISVIHFTYEGKDYYGKDSDFSERKPELFMRVNVNSRLRLREKPNKDSNVLEKIPNGYVSSVLAIDPKLVTIDSIKGYWFQIAYNGKSGWIFSGYTITSWSEHQLNWADSLNFEPEELSSNLADLQNELMDYEINEQNSINGYDLILAKRKNQTEMEECIEGQKLFIYNKKENFIYKSDRFSTSIAKLDHPFKNAILVREEHCGCCCPSSSESIIHLGKTPIKMESFLKDNSMSCSFIYGETSFRYEVTNKFTDNQVNLKYVKTPDCYEFFHSTNEIDIDSEVTIIPPKISNEYFVYSKYGKTLEVEIYKNEGIPKQYKTLWETSHAELK
ncbi:SH3 domain-containing protein [Leptospira biflexa]|uniref:SH3 domain-containing protein n=1 Tax=Leptospira biflexa TaxID=172 RepID=UPI0010914276|nr:SH3 domain-containing protein [Leptospira biflexa]TGM46962.1 SH3 domain-containing protein [Leptospira biflexa]TGM50572.1 SH3 domain-containing protein [Leptospira biflexa]